MTSDVLLKLLDKLGVPGVVLGAMLYAGHWSAENVARPVVARHLQFLDQQQDQVDKLIGALERIERRLLSGGQSSVPPCR